MMNYYYSTLVLFAIVITGIELCLTTETYEDCWSDIFYKLDGLPVTK